MAKIDYESEYNNRARVPEHPQIFAQWERDAAAYRAALAKEGTGRHVAMKYGDTARQTIDDGRDVERLAAEDCGLARLDIVNADA